MVSCLYCYTGTSLPPPGGSLISSFLQVEEASLQASLRCLGSPILSLSNLFDMPRFHWQWTSPFTTPHDQRSVLLLISTGGAHQQASAGFSRLTGLGETHSNTSHWAMSHTDLRVGGCLKMPLLPTDNIYPLTSHRQTTSLLLCTGLESSVKPPM